MSGPPVFPPPPDEVTVRTTGAAPADDATVRTAPPTVGAERPRLVTVAVGLWWAVLALGVVAQLLAVASGALTLTSWAPDESGRIALLVLIATVFALPPLAHWLLLVRTVRRLQQGRGRPRPVLTVLAGLSVVFDVLAVLILDRPLPLVLCAVHALVVVAAVVVTWLPGVTTWMAGPVALVPHRGAPGAPGAGGAAPAGLAAVPVPAGHRPPRRHPALTAGVVAGALVALVGHTVLGIGGSARASLEQQITTGIARQATTPDGPARCPWAVGRDLALGATGTSTCTVDVRGRTYPVAVRSDPTGVWWEVRGGS